MTDEDIKRFEETHKNIPVVKTSAKLGTNVDDSFLELTKKLIIDKNKNGGGDDRKRSMGLAFKKLQLGESGKNQDAGGSCCWKEIMMLRNI